MRKSVFNLFLALGVSVLGACTAKIEGGTGTPIHPTPDNKVFNDPKASITGPNIEGHWLSRCNPIRNRQYRVWELTVTGENVIRQESTFSDSNCTSSLKVLTSHGRFRVIEKYDDGGYAVEYAFVSKNVTVFPQEKIRVSGNKLEITDLVVGASAQFLENEPLFKDGSAPTSPQPPVQPPAPPVSEDAVIATTFTEAKYAFCSNQGFGVMIDFGGYNLANEGEGQARVGLKTCGSDQELKWSSNTAKFVVQLREGRPQITFPSSRYNDRITPSSYQSGLASGDAANSLLLGNSGECFFLTNASTKKIRFTWRCQ